MCRLGPIELRCSQECSLSTTSTSRERSVEDAAGPDIAGLEALARTLRSRIIENSHRTQTPHLGSCLSCVDILVAAYFDVLRIDPAKPRDPRRDRFILSQGSWRGGAVPGARD